MTSTGEFARRIAAYITAAVLLFSAAMKFQLLMTEPIMPVTILESRLATIAITVLITGLAVWLCCGMFRKIAWTLAIAAFGVFTADALYKAISGASSCGCFGKVAVNPWITVCAINLPILIMLIALWPKKDKFFSPPWPAIDHLLGTALPTGLLLTLLLWTALSYPPASETDEYVQVDAAAWTGEAFSHLGEIDIAGEISDGLSALLFYHNDCHTCVEMLPVYNGFSEILSEQGIKIAFIELPPYGGPEPSALPAGTTALTGSLTNPREWITSTPLLIVLQDGVVVKMWENEIPQTLDELLESIFE
ncbi:MAG: MauE/DoxX family redox-associated membrane protein [Phycisphaerae bacterium]|jgi:thiol-disulfide isomerase/thioredoxin